MRIGATQIASTVLSFTANTFYLSLSKISPYLTNHTVGIVGAYTMTIVVEKNGVEFTRKEIPITINSTSAQVKTIDLSNIISPEMGSAQIVGVYNITTTLSYDSNPLVQGSTKSTITIVSDEILIASTVMSESQDKPVEVSLSASINVVFTAYLQGATTFKYKLQIANTIIKQDTIGYFGTEINEHLPVNGDWAVEDAVVPLILTVSSVKK